MKRGSVAYKEEVRRRSLMRTNAAARKRSSMEFDQEGGGLELLDYHQQRPSQLHVQGDVPAGGARRASQGAYDQRQGGDPSAFGGRGGFRTPAEVSRYERASQALGCGSSAGTRRSGRWSRGSSTPVATQRWSRGSNTPVAAAYPISDESVKRLAEMGFGRQDVVAALGRSGGDAAAAFELLIAASNRRPSATTFDGSGGLSPGSAAQTRHGQRRDSDFSGYI